MTANELKNATLKQLREAREAMLELEYLIALESLPKKEQREAALLLSNIQYAYLKLRKAKIAEIREKLDANSKDLQKGIAALSKTLQNLSKAKAIIGAAAKLLSIVGRIVSLL